MHILSLFVFGVLITTESSLLLYIQIIRQIENSGLHVTVNQPIINWQGGTRLKRSHKVYSSFGFTLMFYYDYIQKNSKQGHTPNNHVITYSRMNFLELSQSLNSFT